MKVTGIPINWNGGRWFCPYCLVQVSDDREYRATHKDGCPRKELDNKK